MTRCSIVVGMLLMAASVARAQVVAQGPDLTGRWNRQAGSTEDGSWGAGVRVTQTGSDLTIISREGDALVIDETRSNPGHPPSSTSTTYRK